MFPGNFFITVQVVNDGLMIAAITKPLQEITDSLHSKKKKKKKILDLGDILRCSYVAPTYRQIIY